MQAVRELRAFVAALFLINRGIKHVQESPWLSGVGPHSLPRSGARFSLLKEVGDGVLLAPDSWEARSQRSGTTTRQAAQHRAVLVGRQRRAYRTKTLGHRDRERAIGEAKELAGELLASRASETEPSRVANSCRTIATSAPT